MQVTKSPNPMAARPIAVAGDVSETSVRSSTLLPRLAIGISAAAGACALVAWAANQWTASNGQYADLITTPVVRTDLPITVTERGELESSKTVDVRCEVEGDKNKIVEILSEGTRVTKGQVVIRFDTDQLSRSYAEQEIKARTAEGKAKAAKADLEVQKNKADSEIAQAKLSLLLAEIDLNEYFEGQYPQEKRDLEREILVAEVELKRFQDQLVYSERLHRKGYLSKSAVEADRLAVTKATNTLDSANEKLRMLEKFTRKRREAELTVGADEAKLELQRTEKSQASAITKAESEYEAARITAKLESDLLEKLKGQLDRCQVIAPQEGIVVYSKDRPWEASNRIQEGALVHFQQKLFSLPDLSQMQVKLKIHESVVKKVKPGQSAEIRVDAYPSEVLRGTVEQVATLALSRGWWDEGGVKQYETVIKIESLPQEAGLKPGMTAEVTIHVDHLSGVLVVPVQAVAENDGQHYVYVASRGGLERKAVSVGENNEKFVEISGGLRPGERVTLDARARIAAEAKGESKSRDVAPVPVERGPDRPPSVASS